MLTKAQRIEDLKSAISVASLELEKTEEQLERLRGVSNKVTQVHIYTVVQDRRDRLQSRVDTYTEELELLSMTVWQHVMRIVKIVLQWCKDWLQQVFNDYLEE